MTPGELTQIESALVMDAVGRFTETELEGLPSPVQRYFRTAIAAGTALALTTRIRMYGRIKIGRWLPVRARELLSPHQGFIWVARAAGLISGFDRYANGRGEMNWKLAGLIPVMRADGPDVSRSAAGRAAAEAAWLPTTLLPRFGVEWNATDDTHIDARYQIEETSIHLHCRLTSDGNLQSVVFDRWGDPDNTGEWGLYRFGGEFSGFATFDGLTIPDKGRLGWHYGTDRWGPGEFFRYQITDQTLVAAPFE